MVGRTRVVPTWAFPRIRGTILEVPIIMMAVFGGSRSGSLYSRKVPCSYYLVKVPLTMAMTMTYSFRKILTCESSFLCLRE